MDPPRPSLRPLPFPRGGGAKGGGKANYKSSSTHSVSTYSMLTSRPKPIDTAIGSATSSQSYKHVPVPIDRKPPARYCPPGVDFPRRAGSSFGLAPGRPGTVAISASAPVSIPTPTLSTLSATARATITKPTDDSYVRKIMRMIQHDADTEVVTKTGDVDLRGKFVMPGLVDSNTHVFLHSYRERPPSAQISAESVVERTIRATNHVRAALLAGYTTLRDLGTEGMQSYDTDLRNSINRGLAPGPRLFVATRPLTSLTLDSLNDDLASCMLVDPKDRIAAVINAVRTRAAAGADVIKVYVDSPSHPFNGAGSTSTSEDEPKNPNSPAAFTPTPAFTYAELRALVNEARINKLPVAAHATSADASLMAVEAGASTLEHGPINADDELFLAMRERGCIYVPTLAALAVLNPDAMQAMQRSVRLAYDIGVTIAAGGDSGVFAHGQNARELELLIDAGMPVMAVLCAATINGYRACGGGWMQGAEASGADSGAKVGRGRGRGSIGGVGSAGVQFGWLGEGCVADIVALDADPRSDSRAFRHVDFIMKEGQIWKLDGVRTSLIFGPAMELGFPGQDEMEMGWEVVERPSWRD
ncbi:amidohydrolase domain-containing protein [Ceratocystis lukuohia]|uniref:Amidohydrolase domain-containing protein n=1 Tax=Ceratocystis lukuohia TaxID=2019550 RepID=A0ABR4M9K9_9PEZI